MTTENLPKIKIDSSAVSCGVDYYYDLDVASFKASLKPKKGGPPHPGKEPMYGTDAWSKWVEREDAYLDYWDCHDGDEFQQGFSYIFSDTNDGPGQDIADLIKKHKLGSLVSTRWAKNPNSGHQIKTWIWRYNGKKIPDERKKAPKRMGR
jgi:hypothetical protein